MRALFKNSLLKTAKKVLPAAVLLFSALTAPILAKKMTVSENPSKETATLLASMGSVATVTNQTKLTFKSFWGGWQNLKTQWVEQGLNQKRKLAANFQRWQLQAELIQSQEESRTKELNLAVSFDKSKAVQLLRQIKVSQDNDDISNNKKGGWAALIIVFDKFVKRNSLLAGQSRLSENNNRPYWFRFTAFKRAISNKTFEPRHAEIWASDCTNVRSFFCLTIDSRFLTDFKTNDDPKFMPFIAGLLPYFANQNRSSGSNNPHLFKKNNYGNLWGNTKPLPSILTVGQGLYILPAAGFSASAEFLPNQRLGQYLTSKISSDCGFCGSKSMNAL